MKNINMAQFRYPLNALGSCTMVSANEAKTQVHLHCTQSLVGKARSYNAVPAIEEASTGRSTRTREGWG